MAIDITISNLISKYGQEVTIAGEPSVNTYAFIQPMGWKSKSFVGGEHTRIGFVGGQQYLYIGPARDSIARRIDDILETAGGAYRIIRARDVYFRGRPLYCVGILCEYKTPVPDTVPVPV